MSDKPWCLTIVTDNGDRYHEYHLKREYARNTITYAQENGLVVINIADNYDNTIYIPYERVIEFQIEYIKATETNHE